MFFKKRERKREGSKGMEIEDGRGKENWRGTLKGERRVKKKGRKEDKEKINKKREGMRDEEGKDEHVRSHSEQAKVWGRNTLTEWAQACAPSGKSTISMKTANANRLSPGTFTSRHVFPSLLASLQQQHLQGPPKPYSRVDLKQETALSL